MENYSVYEDISRRTGGDVYLGVVGPVRTGKSTFIKRFMETLVLPNVAERERAEVTDELPQSAGGKTVMTTEPKFVPAKAKKIQIAKGAEVSVRLVDCVGFAVEGASGFEEEGTPRLVKTPWLEQPIPFEKAAEIGTQKVIQEHSTIGILVTTDGSITEIPRSAYVSAEERAVNELKALDKPFVVLLNCRVPAKQNALRASMEEKYGVPVLAVNIETMGEKELLEILQKALFEFPLTSIDVKLPRWVQALPESSSAVETALSALKKIAPSIIKMRDCFALETLFEEGADFLNPDEIKMDLGKGRAEITLQPAENLFYRVLSETSGVNLSDDLELMQFVCELAEIKRSYDKVKDALAEADKNGYGIVYPTQEDYRLEEPQLIKKSAGYGVQFKANASSYHIVKVDIAGSVSPIIGTKQQGEEFVDESKRSYGEDGDAVWETNIFGKSLRALVGDELASKNNAMPVDLRRKMRRVMTRIVNEGKNNIFCLLF